MTVSSIAVACAVIRKGPLYLTVQRSALMRDPLLWEFPGGKIEPGENAFACLHRELDEELGIQVRICGSLRAHAVVQGERRIVLFPMLCTWVGGQMELKEHSDARWLALAELTNLQWCEADLDILEVLQNPLLEDSRWWTS